MSGRVSPSDEATDISGRALRGDLLGRRRGSWPMLFWFGRVYIYIYIYEEYDYNYNNV